MRMKNPLNRKLTILLSPIAALMALAVYANTNRTQPPSGQWIGTSTIDGDALIAKTELQSSATHSATMHIEGRTSCTLDKGTFTPDINGGWTLRFDDSIGGEPRTRLANGAFKMKQGQTVREMTFDVMYPGLDGRQMRRRGALRHYP
jgi:hypothetical protein